MLTLFPVSCLRQKLISKSALLITLSHHSTTLTNYLWQAPDKLKSYTHSDFLTAFLAEWNMLPSSWTSDWWRNVNNDVNAIKWSRLSHVPSNSSPFNQRGKHFAPLMCGAEWVLNEEFHLSSCSASNTTHSNFFFFFLISPEPSQRRDWPGFWMISPGYFVHIPENNVYFPTESWSCLLGYLPLLRTMEAGGWGR